MLPGARRHVAEIDAKARDEAIAGSSSLEAEPWIGRTVEYAESRRQRYGLASRLQKGPASRQAAGVAAKEPTIAETRSVNDLMNGAATAAWDALAFMTPGSAEDGGRPSQRRPPPSRRIRLRR